MKYIKMLGLLAVAAAALMAFAGTASATLTNSDGTNATTIHASSSHTQLSGSLVVTCEESTVGSSITTNDANEASGSVSTLTFEKCGSDTITVLLKGTLKVTDSDGTTGTFHSSGAEVTVLTHRPFIGTIHCIWDTINTDIGTFTESHHKPSGGSAHSTATIHVSSVPLTRTTTDTGCGTHATWGGTYEVTSPDTLVLD
jgi:hypothetical protein